jgi:transcriptional regulator with XRE-family HTH domain
LKVHNLITLQMKNREMTGRHLAELTGISNSIISQIATGRVAPTDDELEKICVALGVTPEQVYPDDQLRAALDEKSRVAP